MLLPCQTPGQFPFGPQKGGQFLLPSPRRGHSLMRSQVREQNSSPHQVRGHSLPLIPRQMHISLQRQSGRLSLPLAQDDDTVYCPAKVEEKVNPSSKWRKLTRTKFNASPKPRQSSFPPQSRRNNSSPTARPRQTCMHIQSPGQGSFSRQSGGQNLSQSSSRELKLLPREHREKRMVSSQRGQNFLPNKIGGQCSVLPQSRGDNFSLSARPRQNLSPYRSRGQVSFAPRRGGHSLFPSPRRGHSLTPSQVRGPCLFAPQIRGTVHHSALDKYTVYRRAQVEDQTYCPGKTE